MLRHAMFTVGRGGPTHGCHVGIVCPGVWDYFILCHLAPELLGHLGVFAGACAVEEVGVFEYAQGMSIRLHTLCNYLEPPAEFFVAVVGRCEPAFINIIEIVSGAQGEIAAGPQRTEDRGEVRGGESHHGSRED